MKKLVIIAVAAIACVAANASSFSWKNTSGASSTAIYDYTGTTKLSAGLTAVLIDVSVTDQATLLAAARNDGFSLLDYGIAGSTATVNSSSKIAETSIFEYGTAGNSYSFYYAILDSANNQLLISQIVANQSAQVADPTLVAFASSATWSKQSYGDAEYSAAGWYSTSVPEPTSGLLLLLGMAGLALKRKHA